MNKKKLLLLAIVSALTVVALRKPIIEAKINARVVKSISHGKQISTSLKLYAEDHGGAYPRGKTSSNEALRPLFPEYIDRERMFYLRDNFFCRPDPPDEVFGKNEGENGSTTLEAGECHFAYVSGLSNSDPSTHPVLADGFTAEANAYDSNHVWWTIDKVVVHYLDGSAVLEVLQKEVERGEVKGKGENSNQNLFSKELLGPGVVLNPLKP
ncbi:MAG: hypothetical protein AAF514_23405 [Verrucomicrobiota bacterium]